MATADNVHDINEGKENTDKVNPNEELKKMSKVEFAVRATAWVTMFAIVTVAVVFGMRKGLKYIEQLQLEPYSATSAAYAVAIAGYAAAGVMAVKTSNAIEKAYNAMMFGQVRTKAEPAPAAA
jgi:hypothetical protein